MDLDDLLDDIEIPDDADDPKKASSPKVEDVDLDAELNNRLEQQALLSFVNVLNQVPPSMKDKWVAIVKQDSKALAPPNKLMTSPSYRATETAPKASNNGVSRACSDAVRNACVKCGFDDVKTAKMTALVNPLEGEAARRLQGLFAQQLIADLKADVLKDPNYSSDASKFPHLQVAL